MEKPLGERCGQPIFASACFGPAKKAMFNVVMLKGEEGKVAVAWFVNVVVLLKLRSKRGGEGREVACVQNMEITVTLEAVEKNLDCICVRWSFF